MMVSVGGQQSLISTIFCTQVLDFEVTTLINFKKVPAILLYFRSRNVLILLVSTAKCILCELPIIKQHIDTISQ